MTDYDNGGYVQKDEIVPLLGLDIKREGTWLMAFCPTHPDGKKSNRRSLGLSENGVLRCFAGCAFKDVMGELRKNAPPPLKPLPLRRVSARAPERAKVLEEVYDYRDPDGKLVAQKARFHFADGEGKCFKWRMPGVGDWDAGAGMPPHYLDEMPLWGAEQIAAFAFDDTWWFVCEGEKAVKACRAHGLVAVCHGGGASTVNFGSSLEVLTNRNVALWPDNDEAGRKYMLRLAGKLKGIAKAVRVISVPVPEKGDAHDYFAGGGMPEPLLDGVHSEPITEFVADDCIVVKVPTLSLGVAEFEFEDLLHDKPGELMSELTVRMAQPGVGEEPYSARINLLSQSNRESLERSLRNQFGKDENWTQVVTKAFSRARAALTDRERGLSMGGITMTSDKLEFLVADILPKNQSSVVFGAGANGKTYWSYSLLLQVAMGLPLWGHELEQCPVIIIDYETSAKNAKWRLSRLMRGLGMDPEHLATQPIHYWPAKGMPIAQQTEALRRYVRKHDIRFGLVDSGGTACGGAPERSDVALAYFNSLERIGEMTWLTICHTSLNGEQAGNFYPFGSRYWSTQARRTYFMRADGMGTDSINVAVIPRKGNDGKLMGPTSYKIDFLPGDGGPVWIGVQDIRRVPSFSDALPVVDQLVSALKAGPMFIHELEKATGLASRVIEAALKKGKDSLFRQEPDAKGVMQWRLAS